TARGQQRSVHCETISAGSGAVPDNDIPVGAHVPLTANLHKHLDKEYQDRRPAALVDAPVAAPAGPSERAAQPLNHAPGITTTGGLGRSQYFRTARAIADLADNAG